MKRASLLALALWAIITMSAGMLCGAVPQMINYQGRLTTPVGVPVNDTANLVFIICTDSLCTTQLWSESHSNVIVKDGLFDAILGSITPIPSVVFDGSVRFLSVSLDGTPITRRMPLVSIGYAYKSINADTAAYAKASAGDIDCSDCDDEFVNAVGLDSVRVKSGTAFLGKSVGSSASSHRGVEGYASNAGSGTAFGGYFSTAETGTGMHTGAYGNAAGSSSESVYGLFGYASNSSGGIASGGNFISANAGTGVHYGLSALANSASPSGAYGLYGEAVNTSSGPAAGGSFSASSSGTGTHYGVYSLSHGASSSTTYGIRSEADNTSTGNVYGGYFRVPSSGTGVHYGVRGISYAVSDTSTYGSYMYSQNTSTGDVYGGYFETGSEGTGAHYGVKAESNSSSSGTTYGVFGEGDNTGTGTVNGGYFRATSSGSGNHFGCYSYAAGGTAGWAAGAYNSATSNTGASAYGTYGIVTNTSTGSAVGGYFFVNPAGSGSHNGVSGMSTANNNATCSGVTGYGDNSGDGYAYGGYFSVPGDGTGTDIALYARAPDTSGVITRAGYFQGNVVATGDFHVMGSKSAVMKVANGEYRSVYCQESTENWFEDFGEGQLADGRTHIELDPMFLQMVTIDAQHPMKVFIQLNDENCKGTAVKRGTTGFDVVELQSGSSNAQFTYRVVAKRRGHEDVRLAKMKGATPEEVAAAADLHEAQMKADRAAAAAESKAMEAKMTAPQKAQPEPEEKPD